jgi:hypothetical protein
MTMNGPKKRKTMTEQNAAGTLLPGVDPAIGEIVLATLQANPEAHPAQIGMALVQAAPSPEAAVELLAALLELMVCWKAGHVMWMEVQGQALLSGARRVTARDAMVFGPNKWPLGCLLFNAPTSITVDTGQGRKRVWIAADDLCSVVIRQSEVTALGNALIESFGGRIIDDRSPEAAHRSFLEQKLTTRAKARAEALSTAERLTVEAHRDRKLRPGHARTALAEAWPGTLRVGRRVIPEGISLKVYEVDRRINESWVSIVAVEAGPGANVEPSAWVFEDGTKPVDIRDSAPPHVGFTDEPAIARGPTKESSYDRPDPGDPEPDNA